MVGGLLILPQFQVGTPELETDRIYLGVDVLGLLQLLDRLLESPQAQLRATDDIMGRGRVRVHARHLPCESDGLFTLARQQAGIRQVNQGVRMARLQ